MKEKKIKKDKYITPEMELVKFERADIITTSGADNDLPFENFGA